MKIVFMGTPDFAVSALEAIIAAGHEITLVVTQPDKEKGRGKQIQKSDVKICAEKYGLPVFQPVRIKKPEAVEYLRGIEADVFVVAAFGQILSQEILDMPRLGCINIHASLLPKYRGSAPIQWSVINGDEKTGVTIMKMDIGVDTGDMLAKRELVLSKDETGGSLFDKLAVLGGQLIVDTLPAIENGTIVATRQNEAEATHAKMLKKEMGHIDFNRSAVEIERLVRGCNPWPGTYTYLDGKTLKLWSVSVDETERTGENGQIVDINKNSFSIKCGEGAIVVNELQLEGKKRMNVHDFLLGYQLENGIVFDKTQEI